MAAANIDVQKPIRQVGGYQEQITLSSLTAGQTETIQLLTAYAPKVIPTEITCATTTEPTSGDPIFFSWTASSASNQTVSVKLRTVAGGDLAGGKVTLNIKWTEAAGGGLS